MCVVSLVLDRYQDRWTASNFHLPASESVELAYLRKEVEELKEWVKRAKKYDEEHGQEDCEMEDKKKFVKEIADAVGVDLGDLL